MAESWHGSLVERVLGYADRPWRALFVVLLLVIAGLGFIVYQERTAVVEHLLHKPGKVELRNDPSAVVSGLFGASAGIDAVSVWKVDLASNTVEFLSGRRRDGSAWEITPKMMRAITADTDPTISVNLLRGEPSCVDPAAGYRSLLARSLAADGMQYVCLVPMPPSKVDLLIGYVVIAWRTRPEEAVGEAGVAAVIRETERLVKRR